MELLERFLRYVSFDTQSEPDSTSYPSTAKQHALLDYLADELRSIGLTDVTKDKWGYVFGTVPATPGCETLPTIGFIAHIDTSPDMPGANVRPQIVAGYDGGDIPLGDGHTLSPDDYLDLRLLVGDTVITTDGTTLLGADDKAGVAAIATAAEHLLSHPEIPHGRIRVGFTPDEEVGRGTDHFDTAAFGADWAYTLDGSRLGEIEYENFNAAQARVKIRGVQFHPGYAKDKMVNALGIACRFDGMLPAAERPEHTSGYEGFYHLTSMEGSVDAAQMEYIIRDFSREGFGRRKALLGEVAAMLNTEYGEGTVTVETRDQYYNMHDILSARPEIAGRAIEAMRRAGIEPIVSPIRGGTDGARLSEMGLPCPNLFTGGANFHSRMEYCSLDTMRKAVEVVINIARAD